MHNVENSPKPRGNTNGIAKCILTELIISKDSKIFSSYTLQPEARIFFCHLNNLFQSDSQIHKYLSVTRKSKSSMHNSQVVQH